MVCGGRGQKWPVEADEAWAYDDIANTHTLVGVIALCPDCHAIRHWGHTALQGKSDRAYAKMAAVNGWTDEQAQAALEEAFTLWEQRSSRTWSSDYSWVTRAHGFEISEEGLARADHANSRFTEPTASNVRLPAAGGWSVGTAVKAILLQL